MKYCGKRKTEKSGKQKAQGRKRKGKSKKQKRTA